MLPSMNTILLVTSISAKPVVFKRSSGSIARIGSIGADRDSLAALLDVEDNVLIINGPLSDPSARGPLPPGVLPKNIPLGRGNSNCAPRRRGSTVVEGLCSVDEERRMHDVLTSHAGVALSVAVAEPISVHVMTKATGAFTITVCAIFNDRWHPFVIDGVRHFRRLLGLRRRQSVLRRELSQLNVAIAGSDFLVISNMHAWSQQCVPLAVNAARHWLENDLGTIKWVLGNLACRDGLLSSA